MTMAADEGRIADPENTAARPLPLLYFILIVAVLTVMAVAAGFFVGQKISSAGQQVAQGKGAEAASPGGSKHMENANLRALAPIVTNLAGSPPVWIRIEASLVFRDVPSDADALSARIAEDIVAFLRTVPVKQIEGATGFQHLSEDLNDRVRVRSNGRVRELVIQGLILE